MRFFIKSYGCQMNSYDSQRMADILVAAGHEAVLHPEEADIVALNTCSIRDKADEKVFSDLGRLKELKEKKSPSDFIIIVAGCMAQLRSQDIMKRASQVDAIVGPQNIRQIAEIVDDMIKNKALDTIVSISSEASDKFSQAFELSNRSVSEFLTIQEGCDNFCTYCIVPYTRGREFSRSVADIVAEAKNLVSFGVKEITLLGQNVNSYRAKGLDEKDCGLSRLLYELANVDGLRRLRYTTSNPKDVERDIAEAHKDIEILAPSLHLPVQSGSDKILKKMNRKYTSAEYLERVKMLREYRPDIAFSSDFIVGFPGETDEDFQQTLELAREVGYAQAYSFKYSPRPGTPAAKMDDQIPEDVKAERLRTLQDLLNDQQTKFNQSFVGRSVNALFVKDGRHEKQLVGRSEYSQAVSVYANNISVGDVAKVKITENASHSLIGVVE